MKPLREYLSRIGKSRGFGIQSPWAYSFVKDVIMEKLPYYEYEEIENAFPNKKECKKQKLYFRIRNFVHNQNFNIMNAIDDTFESIKNVALANNGEGVIVIENIYYSAEINEKWESIRDSEFIGITFDLYDFAICFMPNTMYKQHYKLNF